MLNNTEIEQDLVPEAGVQEVQHRMLGAPYVEVDRHPGVVGLLRK
jgi:hypothetical protein